MRISFFSFFPLFAGLSLFAGQDGTTPVRLKFETSENLSVTKTAVLIPSVQRQDGGQAIVFEAENPELLDFQYPGKRFSGENGIRYVSYVKEMRFRFVVETPGVYRVFYHVNFPLSGGYNHLERMDDGEDVSVLDSTEGGIFLPPNVWHWVKRHSFHLTKGVHEYVFPSPSAFCAGAKLDKVVFLPEDRNPSPEMAVSSVEIPRSGFALTRRIKTIRIREWALSFDTVENGGSAEVGFSYDGTTFYPVDPERKYVPEGEYLYFRIHLIRGGASDVSPVLHDLNLKVWKKSKE